MAEQAHKNRLWLGAALYPEAWSRDVVREDIRRIRDAGLNVVRMGEFAWSTFEPKENELKADWMRAVMDELHAEGLSTVLGTPTATPPRWLTVRHPEIGWVNAKGERALHGGRQHPCPGNPIFRQHAVRIARWMAREFGRHPGLVAWQVDNEPKLRPCICEACRAAWPKWLAQHYGSIDALNEAWGTSVWSMTYGAFAEVPVLEGWQSPPLRASYLRFQADQANELIHLQADAVREHSAAPITTNTVSSADNPSLFAPLDFASSDFYHSAAESWVLQWDLDWLRAIKPGRKFWIMETSPDFNLWGNHPAGYLAVQAFLMWCSGSQAVLYWLWRQQRAGMEIPHPSFLYAHGAPTRGGLELPQLSALHRALEPLLGTFSPAPAPVALVRSDRFSRYLHEDTPPSPKFEYFGSMSRQHRALGDAGLWRDVIWAEADFSRYAMLIVPYLTCVEDAFVARLGPWLERGGAAVLGPCSGTRTPENTAHTNGLLGKLEERFGFSTRHWEWAGATTIEYQGRALDVPAGETVSFAEGPGIEVLGCYKTGRQSGEAWGIAVPVGKGTLYLIGTHLPPEANVALFAGVAQRSGVPRLPALPNTTVIPMDSPDRGRALAVANWGTEAVSFPLTSPAKDALTGTTYTCECSLKPQTCAFLILAEA